MCVCVCACVCGFWNDLINVYCVLCTCIAASGSFLCTLKFIVRDCDPATQEPDGGDGYEDEYMVSAEMLPQPGM